MRLHFECPSNITPAIEPFLINRGVIPSLKSRERIINICLQTGEHDICLESIVGFAFQHVRGCRHT